MQYSRHALRLPDPPLLGEIVNQANRSGAPWKGIREIPPTAIFIGISVLTWISTIFVHFCLRTATENLLESNIIESPDALPTSKSTYLAGLKERPTITRATSWSAA